MRKASDGWGFCPRCQMPTYRYCGSNLGKLYCDGDCRLVYQRMRTYRRRRVRMYEAIGIENLTPIQLRGYNDFTAWLAEQDAIMKAWKERPRIGES